MSRIVERPAALLDGAHEASRVVLPGSDAQRYFDGRRVFEKLPSFLNYLLILSDPEMPRLGGIARTIKIGGYVMTAIQGEDTPPDEPAIAYGFSLGPDSGEFIGVSRIVDSTSEVLSWVDVKSGPTPVFRRPDLTGTIDTQAQTAELTQILAAGIDATEWALD